MIEDRNLLFSSPNIRNSARGKIGGILVLTGMANFLRTFPQNDLLLAPTDSALNNREMMVT
jgi:hypothetical protein